MTHNIKHPDCDIFLDMDLSILGSDENMYTIYSTFIRKEYSHINDQDYKLGR
jgi:predicted metal-dependent HD superfamily phosphohydrolase